MRHNQWFYEGMVLDGRNRLATCKLAGVKSKSEQADTAIVGSLVLYVISKNLRRRQLTPSQCAAAAAEMVPLLAEEAKKRLITSIGGSHPQPIADLRRAESSKGTAAEIAAGSTG